MSEPLEIAEQLRFRPKWWWDPVPDWVVQHIDRAVLFEITVIQMEVQKTILQAQLDATGRIQELMQRQGRQ